MDLDEDNSLGPGKVRAFLCHEVERELHIEIQLILLAFATGIGDATTFPDYGVFASNQTGNTALLGLGALNVDPTIISLSNAGASLGMFIGGCLIFGQLGNYFGVRKRGWLLTTNFAQTILVFAAAGIRQITTYSRTGPQSYAVISLLSFASAGQVACARSLDIPEITTAVVTLAYVDVLVDPNIFRGGSRSRNRRLIFVVALLAGCFVGATFVKQKLEVWALFLAGCFKLCVTVSCLVVF
jgi:uncharacterized membrane protein YoaK (UPF0700 family)